MLGNAAEFELGKADASITRQSAPKHGSLPPMTLGFVTISVWEK